MEIIFDLLHNHTLIFFPNPQSTKKLLPFSCAQIADLELFLFVMNYYKAGTSAEYQALLAEIKQKDKQREELLMKLKVSVVSKLQGAIELQ